MRMEYIALTALGLHQNKIISELAKLAYKNDCNIEDSRVIALGEEIALAMMISGQWNNIAKFETGLEAIESTLGINVLVKRTQLTVHKTPLLPYTVHVVALDHPGIVYELTHFFTTQQIRIASLHTDTYHASQSGSQMFALNMDVCLDANVNIGNLRENFLMLCDELNLDGIIEPNKR